MKGLWRWLLVSLVLSACGGDKPQVPLIEFPDPEMAAKTFLEGHVFDEISALRSRFTREVEPQSFPVRAMVDSPDDYSFERLWRLRTIDNRYVVEAVVRLRDKYKRVTFWLEIQEGNWRISGWAPEVSDVALEAATPSAGADVPVPFAGAAFRGTPTMGVVYLPSKKSTAPRQDLPVKARIQLTKIALGCPEKALRQVLENTNDRFAECYADAIGNGRLRPGRMTYDLEIEGRPATIKPSLRETTLIHSDLTTCVERVYSDLWIDRSDTCEVTTLLLFTPKKKKRR